MKEIIVENYFNTLVMLGHVGMLWWVSSTVLCIAIISHTMNYNNKTKAIFHTKGICALIGVFFLSIIGYGLYMSKEILVLKEVLITFFDYDCLTTCPIGPLFSVVCTGYLIGTSSFVLMLIGWLYVVYSNSLFSSKG